jgi:hypothetical protein
MLFMNMWAEMGAYNGTANVDGNVFLATIAQGYEGAFFRGL